MKMPLQPSSATLTAEPPATRTPHPAGTALGPRSAGYEATPKGRPIGRTLYMWADLGFDVADVGIRA